MSRVLPILFNTEMVRAILDGCKTVTRRVVKPQPQGYFEVNEEPMYIYDTDPPQGKIMPPYQPGDILYVRETWCNANRDGVEPDYYYFADTIYCEDYDKTEWKWHPSIHMPKEAARIWLKVTDVIVERLQDMKIEDFLSEGIPGAEYDIDTKIRFVKVWDSTIKKSDLCRYGWLANPWVWVIDFERCEYPEQLLHSR